jgi:hypothetical protein
MTKKIVSQRLGTLRIQDKSIGSSISEIRAWLDDIELMAKRQNCTGELRVAFRNEQWVGDIAEAYTFRDENEEEVKRRMENEELHRKHRLYHLRKEMEELERKA